MMMQSAERGQGRKWRAEWSGVNEDQVMTEWRATAGGEFSRKALVANAWGMYGAGGFPGGSVKIVSVQ